MGISPPAEVEEEERVEQTGLDADVLFREHAGFVHRAAKYLGVSSSDIDDVTQEVFVVAHRRGMEFEGRAAPRTWLYRICLRVASDWRRRAFRRRELRVDVLPEQVAEQTPETERAQAELRAWLLQALERLDAPKREVFVLSELEEVPMEEVAAIVGCPLKTAYSRLYAARRQLSQALEGRCDE